MKYILSAAVTVSAYTKIEADSLDEAIERARDREVVLHYNGSGTDPEEEWCVESADGEPMDITGEEDA